MNRLDPPDIRSVRRIHNNGQETAGRFSRHSLVSFLNKQAGLAAEPSALYVDKSRTLTVVVNRGLILASVHLPNPMRPRRTVVVVLVLVLVQ